MANDMSEATFRRLLKGILKSGKDMDDCIAANVGKSFSEILEHAVGFADAKKVVRKVKKDQAINHEVIDLRRKVQEQDWEELLITARALVLCGLPYRKTAKRQIVKTARLGNGKELTVIFTAVGKHPLPFGKDRSILALITTIAGRSGSPKVTFQSAMEFLQKLDLGTSGRDYSYLRGAIDRLKAFHCHISAGDDVQEVTGNRAVVLDAVVPSKHDVRSESGNAVRLLSDSSTSFFVELDPTFFREIQDHGVPIPLEVLKPYTNQPAAFDFITFLNYRIRIARNPSRIPMDALCQMLGSEEKNERKIRWRLEKVLEELRGIWPECPARFEGKGAKAVLFVAPPAQGKYLVMDKVDRDRLAVSAKKQGAPKNGDILDALES